MDGDVWLAPEEVQKMADHLQTSTTDFLRDYTRKILRGGWACLNHADDAPPSDASSSSSAAASANTEHRGCCFYDAETRQCSVYDVRPVQCSTYPFWPSIIEDPDAWDEETVLPDDVPLPLDDDTGEPLARHWDIEEGGCEGINHVDAPLVDAATIRERRDSARRQWKRFPNFAIKRDTWYL